MPVIKKVNYEPAFLLKNGHFNTLAPFLLRRNLFPAYKRIRENTPDGDFIDIDTLFQDHDRLVILCHGLEGDAYSQYIRHSADLFSKAGWDVIALNYRGCSGEINWKPQMYHSGFTSDLHYVVNTYVNKYKEMALVGFSLGGNMVMKYLGDQIYPIHHKIRSAAVVSVPCDLFTGAVKIGKWYNYAYEKRFLHSLFNKVRVKNQEHPDMYPLAPLKKITNLMQFDDEYTAPVHGFADAEDYYQKNHCKPFLKNIEIPTVMINAMDDPFLSPECYPYEEADNHSQLFLITPEYGGQVGFYLSPGKPCWEELLILRFLNSPGRID